MLFFQKLHLYKKKDASPSGVENLQIKLNYDFFFLLIHENKHVAAEVQRKLLVGGLVEKEINAIIYQQFY